MIQLKNGKMIIIDGEEENRILYEIFNRTSEDLPVKRKCPICGTVYEGSPIISRKDYKTEICPCCGERETLKETGIYTAFNKVGTI